MESSGNGTTGAGGGSGSTLADYDYAKDLIEKLDTEVRSAIKKHIEPTEITNEKIEAVNSTNLTGMCGDKIVAVNIKFGDVYYHIYILDAECDPQVVKVLGPMKTSVIITGFN